MQLKFTDASTAAAHLLRHLHDARALRNNPLVAHVFAEGEHAGEHRNAALATVHGMVVATAQQLFGGAALDGRSQVHRKRQLEIIMRCDIRGELHKTVQADMGIGARQFYRERLRARAELAQALEALVPAKLVESEANLDMDHLLLANVHAAHVRADDGTAARLARQELESVRDPHVRLELLAILSEILAEDGEFDDARETIERMSALGLDDSYSRARRLHVQADLASLEGRYADAVTGCDAAVVLYNHMPMPHSMDHDEKLVSVLLLASLTKHGIGLFGDALASLQAAREIVERRPEISLQLKVQLLEHLGAAQLVLPGSRAMVESHLLEARAIAQRNGFIREAVACTLYISSLHAINGDAGSLEEERKVLALAQKVHGRAVYAWYCIGFSSRELAAGCYENVVALTRSARACNGSEICVSIANVLEAEALLRLEDAERAHVLTLSAIDVFRRTQNTRFLGNALRISSEAAFRAGRVEYARKTIKEALEVLERYGHPSALTTALEAFKTIVPEAAASAGA